ncbi:MAG: CpaD family pilus assembly lipoprotein [Rickettsiales bacterium]
MRIPFIHSCIKTALLLMFTAFVLSGCQGKYESKKLKTEITREGTVKVSTEQCPDWTAPYTANYHNTVHSNFGCAHAVNLGRMVEDPNDLIGGKGDPNTNAERSAHAVERYLSGESVDSEDSSTGSITGGGS